MSEGGMSQKNKTKTKKQPHGPHGRAKLGKRELEAQPAVGFYLEPFTGPEFTFKLLG